jgi:hypothetical protein
VEEMVVVQVAAEGGRARVVGMAAGLTAGAVTVAVVKVVVAMAKVAVVMAMAVVATAKVAEEMA